MIYEYNNINFVNMATHEEIGEEAILISGIHYDVENSNMNNKSIQYCRWDEDTTHLMVYMNDDLSDSDKTILDDIVNNNSD